MTDPSSPTPDAEHPAGGQEPGPTTPPPAEPAPPPQQPGVPQQGWGQPAWGSPPPAAPPPPPAWAPPPAAAPPPPAWGAPQPPAPAFPAYPAAPTAGIAGTPPASWQVPWGAPPPVWDSPASAARPQRPMFLVGAATLAVGLAIGAVGTVVFARGVGSNERTATLLVDDTPAKAGTAGTAVSVAKQLGPAVGTIIARVGSSSALGSGFVIAHDGTQSYLLTNNHVVAGATELHVVMPGGRNLKASVVGTDSFDDLGVVSVPDGSLPVATFGSSKNLTVGEAVVAIGSPLGNEGSVTEGVISALHRTISAGSDAGGQTETLQDVLQTDASINRGNSGGPLADTEARVVGVNVAIAGDASNIGFSIPADLAKNVARQLIAHQKVQHPYLGIEYFTSIEAVEEGQGFDGPGVLVRNVRSGSPAEKAGFQRGDILQAVNGTSIDNGETLGGLIQQHQVGDKVDFTVKRNGSVVHLSAVLTDRPSSEQ